MQLVAPRTRWMRGTALEGLGWRQTELHSCRRHGEVCVMGLETARAVTAIRTPKLKTPDAADGAIEAG